MGIRNLKFNSKNGQWIVRLVVPKDVRGDVGRYEFKKWLGSVPKQEAQILAHQLLADWRTQIQVARGKTDTIITNFKTKPLSERLSMLEQIELQLRYIKPHYTEQDLIQYAVEAFSDALSPDSQLPNTEANTEAVATALGIVCNPADHVDEYADMKLSHLKERSRDEHKSVLVKIFCKSFPVLDDKHYSKSIVVGWWERMAASGKSQATLRKYLQRTQAYTKWLCQKGYLNKPDYFSELEPITKRQVARTVKDREPFTDDDVLKLLHFADDQLKPLIMFGAYTGCRIEELCNLTVDDVYSTPIDGVRRFYLDIPVSKTKKGLHRKVPLHPLLEEYLPESGYLIDVRKGVNKYGERSAGIGKKFGRLKSELGFKSEKVFHSLRKSFVDKLKQVGCSEVVSADIVGHEVPTMTYGLYASGTPVEQLFEWVDRVEYKTEVIRVTTQLPPGEG